MTMSDTATADVTTIRLPHTGLRVPDRSLSLTRYRALRTSDGVAFTANLRVRHRIVGQVENSGHGGQTLIIFHDRRTYGDKQLDEYAAQCSTQEGAQVTADQLIDDLVTEHDFTSMLAGERRRGRTLLRLMAYPMSTDDIRAEGFPPYPQELADAFIPRSPEQWTELARQVQVPDKHSWWQAWTGEQWLDITARPAGTDPDLYQ